jgi:hypothetical protein
VLDHFTQGYVITAGSPRCHCYRDVDLARLIRSGKADKPASQLRIRHKQAHHALAAHAALANAKGVSLLPLNRSRRLS